jgi:hypothetical protein
MSIKKWSDFVLNENGQLSEPVRGITPSWKDKSGPSDEAENDVHNLVEEIYDRENNLNKSISQIRNNFHPINGKLWKELSSKLRRFLWFENSADGEDWYNKALEINEDWILDYVTTYLDEKENQVENGEDEDEN